MKHLRYIALFALLASIACEQHRKSAIDESGSEIVKVRTPSEDTIKKSVSENQTLTVAGKVLDINNGKDGYTAEIKTTEGKVYDVTISRANLTDHTQYQPAALGDRLKVTGDFWSMEGRNQITVRQIHK